MVGPPRRRLLALGASAALGFLAGCVTDRSGSSPSGVSNGSSDPSARASFFVFGDFATHVAGDIATAETLVPVGQHGHGWEPGPKVREAILAADLFVYGTAGFQPWADDIVRDLRANNADVRVVPVVEGMDLLEAAPDDHGEEDPEEDDHDVPADPHFWLDPLRATQAVDTIREGFVAIDPDNTAAYEAAATAYQDRLDDLHESLESSLADRSRDVILVAGHDAFRYLDDQYGFEVEALSGLAPDDIPSTRDIARAQDLIEEYELEYVCADPLESQRAAEQLVAETDATEILPLTSLPGLQQAWADDGWGYVEIMERVNLPTLQRALDTA